MLTSRSKVEWQDIPWLSHWLRKRLEGDLLSKAYETSPKRRRWTILIHFLSCFARRTLLLFKVSVNFRLTFLQTFLQAAPAPWHNFYCSPVEIPKVPEPKHVGSPFCVPRWRVLGQKHEVFSTRECMAELLCIRIRFCKYMVVSIQNDSDSVIYSVCLYISIYIYMYRWSSYSSIDGLANDHAATQCLQKL